MYTKTLVFKPVFLYTLVSPAGIETYSFSTPCGYFASLSLAKFLTRSSIPWPHTQKPALAGFCIWCPQQESNLHQELRSLLFYPLNYEDKGSGCGCVSAPSVYSGVSISATPSVCEGTTTSSTCCVGLSERSSLNTVSFFA